MKKIQKKSKKIDFCISMYFNSELGIEYIK